ncbi:oligosaccharide flippase family protein [Flaviaesturariibacter aridisoli]|uniref:Polysaccharide biosynthesis protein n=1 Tax=Flaviaesturariibacter aridisoli TaxID=2545761 RepID=A0A4R4E012_9BACT|nr:oligosaccharide flippase family protein [Flaviaesturariibacter aridisoli]TCZ72734.1 polysaccharide biosynthesis protein [Flaviaesturariibacter aridisoli]
MNLKSFLRSLSWLVVLNVLVKPLWVFGIDRKVQVNVGHERYGTYFAILNLAIILSIIADAGLTNMLNRRLALQQRVSIRRLVLLKCGLSALYFAALCLIAWLTRFHDWPLILLTGALQLASSFLLLFRNMVTGYQQFRADAWLSITDKSVTILLCAPLLYLPLASRFSLETFLWIQLGSTLLAVVLAAFIAARHHEAPAERTGYSDLFRQSAPFVLLILLMSVHTRLDAFLLERMHPSGALQAGIYAAAYRLLDAGNTVGYMTAAFLVPFAARHLADRPLIDSTTLRLRHGLLLAAGGFVALCSAFAPQIIALLYHTDDAYTARVLVACVAVLPAYYGIHIYGSLLTAAGRFRFFNGAVLGSVLLNTALNLWLIPRLGALGCCYAALASQYACAATLFVGAQQHFALRLHPVSLLACALLGTAGYSVGRLLLHEQPAPLFWWLNAAIAASLIMFVLFTSVRGKRPSS